MRQTRLLQGLSISIALALAGAAAAAPEALEGSRFITVMRSNTLSGTTEAGAEFNVYFLEGGRVTYEDSAGERDDGSWRMDPDGDVCLRWTKLWDGAERCFRVTLDGDAVSWQGKTGGGEGQLRGGIAASFLKAR